MEAGARLAAAAAEEVADAVPDTAAGAPDELAPGFFGGRRAVEFANALLDQVAEATVFAGVEPPAVFVLAGVEFERVRPVVEGDHPLAADGAVEVALAFCIDFHAAACVVGCVAGLELIEFVVVEPASVALRAAVDFDAATVFDDEFNLVSGAKHVASVALPGLSRCARIRALRRDVGERFMEVPLLVNDFLRRAAKLYPNKTAIVDGERRFTYREYQERCNQLGQALLDLGIQKGDRVCILSPNSHFFLESYYGVTQIGAILVPLNYRLVAADHEYIINHAGVKVVLVDYEYTQVVDGIRENLKTVEHFIVAQDHTNTAPPGWVDWETLIADKPKTATPFVEQDENDVASINYTSGTTARPKGVMLTHRNAYINAYNFIAHLRITHDDVELWTLPMFHANGWGGPFALTAMGATHVVLRAIVAEDIYRLIQDEGVTFACMAPAVLSTILNFDRKHEYTITTKPRFVIAGAPPPAAFVERLEEELGWEFLEIYGLTETAPIITVSHPDYNTERTDYSRRMRAGVEAIGCDIQVLDDDGNPVPKDNKTIGEVCARGNMILKGYWEQPEETAKAIYDGYFHTGDLAVWDEFSNIHIVDRKKDVIISGGENISSAEVEDALYKHPAVLECAVIGVPHEKWGETPKALVVLREGHTATEQEIIDFTREHLAHFKCPTSVDFVEQLPRTATGKLQKFILRERYWEGAERRVN